MTEHLDPEQFRLMVDPITCDGRGLCAELLPEWIELDDWGYPIVRERPDAKITEQITRRTIAACPTLALRLEQRASQDVSDSLAAATEVD
jgi:ferredoxin